MFFELFQLLALPSYFQVVLFDLLIQIALLFFQRLDPIADQCAGSQSEPSADGGAGGRMTYGAADDSTSSGTSDSTDGRSLFTGSERLRTTQQ